VSVSDNCELDSVQQGKEFVMFLPQHPLLQTRSWLKSLPL